MLFGIPPPASLQSIPLDITTRQSPLEDLLYHGLFYKAFNWLNLIVALAILRNIQGK